MTRSASPASTDNGPTSAWLAGLGALIVVLLAVVAWVQWRQSTLMSQAMLVGGDNMMHFLYQADNEYLRLREAWPHPHTASHTVTTVDADADVIKLRYDIFVSRIQVLRNALRGHELLSHPGVSQALADAEAFIRRADAVLASDDAQAVRLRDLERLYPSVVALGDSIREFSLEASNLVNVYGTQVSNAGRAHNRLGIAMSLGLAVLALAFAAFSSRQVNRLQQRKLELEALTEALAQARQAAEAAAEAKGVFLANMSHEIRTPFQGVQGMLKLLGGTSLDDTQRGYVRTASASAQHLLTLLNDILDLSRLESGHMVVANEAARLGDLLADIEALMRPMAEGKGLRLDIQVEPQVPAVIEVDPTRFRQILFNLLSNAIKFTERGLVLLQVTCEVPAEQDAPAQLTLAVTDTGIGMDEETLARLFQRFSQGDASRTRRFGGTGLGLEISRGLARLMGGDIDVTSRVGLGSTFRCTLPVRLPVQPDALTNLSAQSSPLAHQDRSTEPVRQTPLRLLVAEDNEVNRMVMRAVLDGMDQPVTFAVDGRDAVAQAATQDWDLILMDLHMPEMDGLEATRTIRALHHPTRARVPIVALTADVFPETRQHCREAGIVDLLSKPVDNDELARLLARTTALRNLPAP